MYSSLLIHNKESTILFKETASICPKCSMVVYEAEGNFFVTKCSLLSFQFCFLYTPTIFASNSYFAFETHMTTFAVFPKPPYVFIPN